MQHVFKITFSTFPNRILRGTLHIDRTVSTFYTTYYGLCDFKSLIWRHVIKTYTCVSTYYGLLGDSDEIFHIVILMLLEGREEKIHHMVLIQTRLLSFLLLPNICFQLKQEKPNSRVEGSHRELIIKFPDFPLIFQRHKVKFPDYGDL